MSKTSNSAKIECLKIWIDNLKYRRGKKEKPTSYSKKQR